MGWRRMWQDITALLRLWAEYRSNPFRHGSPGVSVSEVTTTAARGLFRRDEPDFFLHLVCMHAGMSTARGPMTRYRLQSASSFFTSQRKQGGPVPIVDS